MITISMTTAMMITYADDNNNDDTNDDSGDDANDTDDDDDIDADNDDDDDDGGDSNDNDGYHGYDEDNFFRVCEPMTKYNAAASFLVAYDYHFPDRLLCWAYNGLHGDRLCGGPNRPLTAGGRRH